MHLFVWMCYSMQNKEILTLKLLLELSCADQSDNYHVLEILVFDDEVF